jgi:NAD(P)-dependent dehydrogenase (short-subunit alcohol dehydrogenase family)
VATRETASTMTTFIDVPEISFDGQVAIVTGAGRGLGAAYAKLLAARGAAVVVHDAGVAQDGSGLDPEVANRLVQEIVAKGGIAAACHENLEEAAACRRVVAFAMDRYGRLDALVHNAGLVIFADLDKTEPEVWNRMVNLGVHAPFHLVQAALPHMRRQTYGRIVLTTSGRALSIADSVPGLAAYNVGKMAQLGLMVGVAAELKGINIMINAISPVAATRVLRRSAPELLPELVAPGAGFLASSACVVSGVVLCAAGGRFSTARWRGSDGIYFGPTPVGPEVIAARWSEIVGTAD